MHGRRVVLKGKKYGTHYLLTGSLVRDRILDTNESPV